MRWTFQALLLAAAVFLATGCNGSSSSLAPAATELTDEAEIEVTVETGESAYLAFLHVNHRGIEMTNNGDGTYSGIYAVSDIPGRMHVAVGVLTEETLMNDDADYDGNAWAIHY